MKKIISSLLFALLTFSVSTVSAQFEKGDKLLNAGIGGGGFGWLTGFAVGASMEVGVTDFIGVGAQADFRFYNNWAGRNKVALPIAARGAYHFGKHFVKVDNLDLYGGVALGFTIGGKYYDDDYVLPYLGKYDNSAFVGGVFAGGRYYFADNIGAFAELSAGSNVLPIKAGITFKF
jgi:hypothetical protein